MNISSKIALPVSPAGSSSTIVSAQPLRRNVSIVYLTAVLLYGLLFTVWQLEPVPWPIHLTAILVFATCLLPLALWYSRGSQGLPLFELICLSYALQFSTPLYHQPNSIVILSRRIPLPWDGMFQTLLYVELGIVALIGGFYSIHAGLLIRALPTVNLPFTPEQRSKYLKLAFAGGGAVMLLQLLEAGILQISAIGAIVGLAINQFTLALILLAYQVYGSPRIDRSLKFLLYLIVTGVALLGFSGGLLEQAFVPIVLLFLVRWHASGKLPIILLAFGFLMYVLISPVKNEFRQQVWYNGAAPTLVDRILLWVDLGTGVVGNIANGSLNNFSDTVLRPALSRFDLLHKFVYIQEMTPRLVPYYQGETYGYLIIGWIPRFIWPDKPSASEANRTFDIDYQLIIPQQTSTTISIGQLPEAFANFGVIGILVVMLFQGILFGSLDKVLNGPRSEGGRAVYLSLMVFFFNGIGSSTAIWFGALLQNMIANALILRLFTTGFRPPSGQAGTAQQARLRPVETPTARPRP